MSKRYSLEEKGGEAEANTFKKAFNILHPEDGENNLFLEDAPEPLQIDMPDDGPPGLAGDASWRLVDDRDGSREASPTPDFIPLADVAENNMIPGTERLHPHYDNIRDFEFTHYEYKRLWGMLKHSVEKDENLRILIDDFVTREIDVLHSCICLPTESVLSDQLYHITSKTARRHLQCCQNLKLPKRNSNPNPNQRKL